MKKSSLIVLLFITIGVIINISKDNFLYIISYPVLLIPYVIGLKFRVNEKYLLIYTVFIFMSYFMGSIMGFYDYPYYDKFMHFFFGYSLALAAIETKKISILNVLMLSLSLSVLWEFFEYFSDLMFKGNAQRIETGVNDTMLDMIIAFVGTLVYLGFWRIYGQKN